MRVIEGLQKIERLKKPVLTIGNFDGIHIGHQKIIEQVKNMAEEIGGISVVMTFDPHPLHVLKPEKILGLITPLPVKKRIFDKFGIDVLLVIKFENELRELNAEEFVRTILLKKIGISGLVLGSDFRFGRDAEGDVNLIENFSKKHGFSFIKIDPVALDGEKVGSNKIRKMIIDGDVKKAAQFLGRPFTIVGRVIYGAGIGKKIGYPTANLAFFENQLLPKNGVYVTEIEFRGQRFPSVTNVGLKPTFRYDRISIETHILNFHEDIYGMELEVIFYERIRDEERFASVKELIRAIEEDIRKAEILLNLKT
ncbi:MAG: bifunctional riboflavin kinase/FAD synthetase [Deltaproteobacteria bacterium]|nr:bifunctional riboflavin kinase/FAD synthetase [Deltaproteobacteria bacterium]